MLNRSKKFMVIQTAYSTFLNDSCVILNFTAGLVVTAHSSVGSAHFVVYDASIFIDTILRVAFMPKEAKQKQISYSRRSFCVLL